MNILFLLTQSLDSPSGVGRYAPLARQLCNLGHHVTIIALHPDFANLKDKKQEIEGVRVHYVSQMHVRKAGDTKSYFSTPALIFLMVAATWRMSLAALHTQADIIHVCKPHPMNGIAGWVAHLLRGGQLWLDSDDYEAASGRFSSRAQQKVVAWFEKHLPGLADHITTNTYFMQDKLISWGVSPLKIHILPNGIDPDRFSPPPPTEVEALRNQLKLNDSPIVIYVGSLSLPSHPLDLLLDAFEITHKADPKIKLLIVGGGEDFLYLQQRANAQGIGPSVLFCGRVSTERVVLYYHLASVSVDPIYDNDAARGRSPLKLFESWACGIPFVSGDVGDRRHLLGDPLAGVLVKPGNPISLAHQILMLLANPAGAEEIKNRGLERVKAYYWNQIAIEVSQNYSSSTSSGSLQ